MPGHAGSPYWTAVDFDSEEDEDQQLAPNNRVYLDPWDNDAYGMIQADTAESSQGDNFNSFAGEPVSASFYYVPTKNYDSGEEAPALPPPRRHTNPEDHLIYSRKSSRAFVPDFHPDMAIYSERITRDRRRSMYIEEPVYPPHPGHHQMIYEPLYGPIMPAQAFLPPPPRSRMSLPHHPEHVMASLGFGKTRRHSSRLADAYEQFAYDNTSPEYEDWARPFPKTAPDNFHLSRYGHLQIDYSCSWNSLDRLIRNQ